MSFYRWRLRRHLVHELLAGGGIAVGVAIVFGVSVANTSLTGPAHELLHGLQGTASLQLAARSNAGFDQRLLERVRHLPGVAAAAPLLRADVAVGGPRGRQSVQLVGVTPGLIGLGSLAARDGGTRAALAIGALGLPAGVARAIGARPHTRVNVIADGAVHTDVSFHLKDGRLSFLASSEVVVASLQIAQEITRERGRVTQILVKPRAGADAAVSRELRRLAAGRIDVEPADSELRRLDTAAKPNNRATLMFAAIGAMVGFLLTLNAMLLTVPERRRFVLELRTHGFERRRLLMLLGFQALTLGVAASLLGILLGYALSQTLFHQSPAYLAFAFPIGVRQVVHARTIALAFGSGLLATFVASLATFVDLRGGGAGRVAAAAPGAEIDGGRPPTAVLALCGVLLIAAATAMFLAVPRLAIAGGALLTLAGLFLIPASFLALVNGLARLAERMRGSMLALCVAELRATPLHSIGLAGVVALAVYSSVAIAGARSDLIHGLDRATAEFFATGDVWVTSSVNDFATTGFEAANAWATIEKTPGVASVRIYQGGLLNVGPRRMWLRARPSNDPAMIEAGQIVEGDAARADALLRAGGWAAVSSAFADEHHLHVGERFTLPTPAGPVRLGVAALTTNGGWPPGTITVDTEDYDRYWGETRPAALEVDLRPNIGTAVAIRSIERALGAPRGLRVHSSGGLYATFDGGLRAGLRSLGEIATLLLVAAALAVALALSATIWQRRSRIASLKIQGFERSRLWRALMLESAIVVGVGALVGATLGVYGHALADRWLALQTGFPAPFAFGEAQVLLSLAFVGAIALVVLALPGVAVTRVPVQASFQE